MYKSNYSGFFHLVDDAIYSNGQELQVGDSWVSIKQLRERCNNVQGVDIEALSIGDAKKVWLDQLCSHFQRTDFVELVDVDTTYFELPRGALKGLSDRGIKIFAWVFHNDDLRNSYFYYLMRVRRSLRLYRTTRGGATYTPESLPQKLIKKIETEDGGCWLWGGSKAVGYGRTNWNGKNTQAHRLVYSLLVGSVNEHHYVRHLCHRKACVNPHHLKLGDALVNSWDERVRRKCVSRTPEMSS